MTRSEKRLFKFAFAILSLPFKVIAFIARMIFWVITDRRFNAGGYVLKKSKSGRDHFEHRDIAEKILDRPLASEEVVHHINGKRDDNNVSNLCVMSHYNHVRFHEYLDWVKKKYKRYPSREKQLQRLQNEYHGILLEHYNAKRASSW